MQKEEITIVVPGVKYLRSKNRKLQKAISFLYGLTNTTPDYHNPENEWSKSLSKCHRKIIWLHWKQEISPLSKHAATKKLKNLIDQYKNFYKINLIGSSLGGEIVLETINKIKDGTVNIAIVLSSINENTKVNLKKTKIINIYSPYDKFRDDAIFLLAPIHGGRKLCGKNVKNIIIPKFSHDKFYSEEKVKFGRFKGKKITQIINHFLNQE